MILRRFFAIAIVGIITLSVFNSCENNNQFEGFEMTEDSLFYKYHTKSEDTQSVQTNDILSAYFTYRKEDSVFNQSNTAAPTDIQVLESTYKGDIYDALKMMHIGDSMTFILNTKDFFEITVGTKQIPSYLDSVEYFYLDVRVDSIKSFKEMEAKKQAEREKFKAEEPGKIQKYLNEHNITEDTLAGGLIVSHTKTGNGKAVKTGSHIDVHYKVKVIGNEWFEDTRARNQSFTHLVGTGRFGAGFDQAVTEMKEGGKAVFVIPSNLAFGAEGVQGIIPPYSPLIFDVEVVKVYTKEEFEKKQEEEQQRMMEQQQKAAQGEQVQIEKYLNENNINVQPTESGLYYFETVKGDGVKAEAGTTVKVHYDGYLLDGTKFDSSHDRGQPFEFVLGQGQVIPGWDQGIQLMNVGGKAKLIIPSRLAYGSRGAGSIPPNSPLVFDVELLEVTEK